MIFVRVSGRGRNGSQGAIPPSTALALYGHRGRKCKDSKFQVSFSFDVCYARMPAFLRMRAVCFFLFFFCMGKRLFEDIYIQSDWPSKIAAAFGGLATSGH